MATAFPPNSEMAAGKERLIRCVILIRHGIRSPKESDATLRKWSTRSWPKWPGNPGDLTARGKELLKAQWASMKPFFIRNSLIPDNGVPDAGNYALIADEDQRTRMTAMAVFEGLFPESHVRPQYGRRFDQLFHPDSAAYRLMDRQKALAEVQALLDPLESDPEMVSALDLLQQITMCCHPSLCGETGGTSDCSLQGLPFQLSIDPHKSRLDIGGKWFVASTLAEIMLLEFAQWPDRKPGWGKLDEAQLRQLIPVHNRVFNATHRAPSLARAGGTHLIDYIRDTLLSDKSPQLTLLVGHDTNIAYSSGLLDIHWSDAELGNDPVIPGSFQTYEFWENKYGKTEIRIRFSAPSLHSLRHSPASLTDPVWMAVDKAVWEPDTFIKRIGDATRS